MSLPRSLSAALLLYLASYTAATPLPSYPLSLQYPPLIQYGKSYSYQIPSDTFTSSDSTDLVFNATGLPDWLSFDSDTRTFSGTAPAGPDTAQNNDLWFQLSATDSSGSLAVNSSLTVTNIDVTTLNTTYDLTTDLQNSGNVSSSNSLILHSNEQFSIQLSSDAFNSSSISPIIQYVSLSSSHTPLPIWISFDSGSFTFSGQAPTVNSEIAPSETFSFKLFAIQVTGSSSVALDFSIQVGAHQFSTNVTTVNEHVSPGDSFSYKLPFDEMFLDGVAVTSSNIANVSTSSSWLAVDDSKTSLKGTVPNDFEGGNCIVTVTSTYSDSIDILMAFSVNNTNSTNSDSSVFLKSSLSSTNATIGKYFSYTLPSDTVNATNVNVSSSFDPEEPWLSFSQNNMTLSGSVPDTFNETKVTLTNDNDDNDKIEFTIKAIEGSTSSSSTSTSSSTASSSPSSPSSSGSNSGSGISNKTIAIICGAVIPVVVLLALLILFLCCRRRKKVPRSISRPILPEDEEKENHSVITVQKTSRELEKPPGILTNPAYRSSTEKLHESYVSSVYTPTSGNFSSPGRVTEINMYKLDNPKSGLFDFQASPISFFSEGESEGTHVDDHMEDTKRNIFGDLDSYQLDPKSGSPVATGTSLGATYATASEQQALNSLKYDVPAIPPRAAIRGGEAIEAQPEGQPRNSWRQTNQSEKRWHPRAPGGSVASISPDEIPSVRLVRAESSQSAQMPRENSSPILRTLTSGLSNYSNSDNQSGHTSNSASIGSYSSSESETGYHYGPTVPYTNTSNLGAIAESPHIGSVATPTVKHTENTNFTIESTDDLNDVYRTASSGDDYLDAESSDGEIIQPRINSRGEWEWEQVAGSTAPIMFGQAIDSPVDSRSNYGVDGDSRSKPNAIGPARSTSTIRQTLERKTSTKLVSFTKERSTSISNASAKQGGLKSVSNGGLGSYQSVSAELSFI